MKKLNVLRNSLLLAVTFIMLSFINKEHLSNFALNTETKESTPYQVNNTLLITYVSGTTEAQKQAIRLCLVNSFEASIISITPCSVNQNAEVLEFHETIFPIGSNGKANDDDDDSKDFNQITFATLNNAINSCSNFNILSYSTIWECSDLSPFVNGDSGF
ncbi:conserved protein of unknown function [Tenacibaculum sp. 190130A14a]|uniref:Flavodoxin-like domain-containing protein n=1 Tax=Tenacibaculum polynesiense TaxID=3137857 RepID=A0ABP1ES56_9FLAO